jgi:hypothetical protein
MGKDAALNEFNKKFREKTVAGDYIEIEIKYDDNEAEEKKAEEVNE